MRDNAKYTTSGLCRVMETIYGTDKNGQTTAQLRVQAVAEGAAMEGKTFADAFAVADGTPVFQPEAWKNLSHAQHGAFILMLQAHDTDGEGEVVPGVVGTYATLPYDNKHKQGCTSVSVYGLDEAACDKAFMDRVAYWAGKGVHLLADAPAEAATVEEGESIRA